MRCRYTTTVYFAFLIFLDGLGYELDGPEFEFCLVDIFLYIQTRRDRPRGPTEPPLQWMPWLFPQDKAPGASR